MTDSDAFCLSIFDRSVVIRCAESRTARLIDDGYGRFAVAAPHQPDLVYSVTSEVGNGFVIERGGGESFYAQDDAEFLFLFEKDLTLELERLRSDLFFVHAAVVASRRGAIMLVAPSGTGKSTLTWALLHRGFQYVSDELAPVDPVTLNVHPYPHALCLKTEPPLPFPLPVDTRRAGRTLHVPVRAMEAESILKPLPLAAIFFIFRDADAGLFPAVRLSAASAGARLYANSLNALAHPRDGLECVLRMGGAIPGYELECSDLERACTAIAEAAGE